MLALYGEAFQETETPLFQLIRYFLSGKSSLTREKRWVLILFGKEMF
jgi:hypothetical protein